MKKIIMEDEEILSTVFPESRGVSGDHVGDGQALGIHKDLQGLRVFDRGDDVVLSDGYINLLNTLGNELKNIAKEAHMWSKAGAYKVRYSKGSLKPIYKP